MKKKTVVAKGYYGLGGNLSVLASAMRLAKNFDCNLVVDWKDGFYGLKEEDIFSRVFKYPDSNLELLTKGTHKVWPPEWQDYIEQTRPHKNINGLQLSRVTSEMIEDSNEILSDSYDTFVVSRDDKYWHHGQYESEIKSLLLNVRLADSLQQKVDSYDVDEDTVAVHFRHGNGELTVVPPDINWFYSQVDKYLDRGAKNIFLCTDCFRVIELFRERYPGLVFSSDKKYPANGQGAMHYAVTDTGNIRAISEAIIDIWTMAKAGFLVGSKSFFTGASYKLSTNLVKERTSIWVPEVRSHKPASTQTPLVNDSDLSNTFKQKGIPTDGLYVERKGRESLIFYLHNEISTFTNLDELKLDDVHARIKALRYY